MRKFLLRCLLAVALMAPSLLSAQTLTVCDGTSTYGYAPFYGYYMDASQTAQMLYPDSMLTSIRGNAISSVTYYTNNSTDTYSYSSTMTVSMAVVTETSIGSDLLTATMTDLWTGHIAINNGIVTIDFEDPFIYPADGGNLLVQFHQSNGGGYHSASFYGIDATGMNYTWWSYGTNNQGFLPKMTMAYAAPTNCTRPNMLHTTRIAADSVYLSWNERGSATSWDVIVSAEAVTDFDNATFISVNDTTVGIGGLGYNQMHYAYVRANCGSEYSAWTSAMIFRTACGELTGLPYFTNFDQADHGDLEACWTNYATGSSGAGVFPMVYNYSYNAHSGPNYFEMESNSGETEIVALPTFDNSEPLQMEFYATTYGTNAIFEIGYMDDTTFVSLDTMPLYNGYGYDNDPILYYFTDVNTATITPAFRTSYSGSYTVFIDDLSIEVAPNCMPVTLVQVDSIASNELWISWNGNGSSSWEVLVSDTVVTNWDDVEGEATFDNPYYASDLLSNTAYYIYVRSDCGGEMSPWSNAVVTRTGCAEFADAPYSDDFEMLSYSDIPTCWTTYNSAANSDYPYIDNYSYYAHSGENSMYFSYYNNSTPNVEIAALPRFEDLSLLQFSFYAYAPTTPALVETGIYTDSVFIPIDTIQVGSSYGTEPFVVYFDGFEEMSGRPAVRVSGNTYNMYMDDVNVSFLPDCLPVSDVVVSNPTTTSVDLSWTNHGDASAWNVVVSTTPVTDFSDATIINVTDNPVTINNLNAATNYYFYVQSDCGGEGSEWAMGTGSTVLCDDGCSMTVVMIDSYGDGWNGNAINLVQNNNIVSSCTLLSGNFEVAHPFVCPGDTINFQFVTGSYTSEVSFKIVNTLNDTVFTCTDATALSNPFFTYVTDCAMPSCNGVSNITLDSATANSIAIHWTANSDASAWYVEYATQPFTFGQGEGTMVNANETNVEISNLLPNTMYYFMIATNCGSDTSYTVSFSARTECDEYAAIPYTDGFETYNTYALPNCWQIIDVASNYSSNSPYVYNYNAHQGSKVLEFDFSSYYGGTTNTVALPKFQNVADLMMSFYAYAYNYGYPDIFEVGIYDDSVFVPIDTITLPTAYAAEPITVYFSDYTGIDGRPAFRTSGSSVTIYLDDITVDVAPDCLPVQNVVATATSSTEVELTWTNNGSTAWNVYYSTTPVTDFSGVNATAVTTNPYTVTGLTAGTQYYFYVQADCGAGTTAPWAGSNAEQTLRCDDGCELFFVMEDEFGDGWNSASIGVYAGTALIGTATVPTSGSNYIQSVLMCAGDSISLQWNTGSYDEECSFSVVDAYDTELYSCTDGSTLSGEFFTMVASCTPVTCDRPADLTASNITASNATLTWTSDAAEFIVTVSAGSTTDSYVATTNTYNVAGLSPMTSYTWTVTAICAPGDTSRTATSTFMTTLCDNPVIAFNYDTTTEATTQQQGPGYSYYNYSYSQQIIDSAYMAAMNGSDVTGFAFNVAVATAGDRFNNCEVWMANVDKSSFTDQDDWVILSDSNATLVYTGSLNFSETGWNTFGFNTPFTWDGHSNVILAVNRGQNQYLMGAYWYAHETTENKHIIAYQDDAALDMSNPPYSYGAAHNYTYDVQLISCGAGCGTPSVSVTNYDYGQATIAWSGSADNYEVAIKMANEANWPAETAVNNANTYTFTNLQPATTYNVRVRQICDAAEGLISSWGVATFTTDSLPCFAPEALEATAVQGQQATLAWTAGGNENAWNLHVFNTTFDQTYQATATTYTVTGLTAGVTYYAAVSAVCGNGVVMSDYSDTISFTTVVCDPVTNVAVSGITNNSATITWTAGANNTGSWEVAWNYHGAGMAQPLGSQVVQATSFTINGLSASTPYDVAVRALCGQNYNSTYAESQFTTLEGQGIDRVDDGLNLAIFPNPASSNATITLSGVNGKVNVAVVDMSGRTVFNTTMECNGDCEKKLNVENLASGAYFVRVYGENVNAVKRLVVK